MLTGKFPVIYADPPWQYENPPMGGGNRSIENHYPTMTLEQICALPIAEIVADDAILYLWLFLGGEFERGCAAWRRGSHRRI